MLKNKDAARKILYGELQLVGVNTLSLEPDTVKCPIEMDTDSLLKEIQDLKEQNKVLKEENSELQHKLTESQSALGSVQPVLTKIEEDHKKIKPLYQLRVAMGKSILDEITFYHQIYHNPSEEDKKEFADFCDQHNIYPSTSMHGNWSWVNFHDKSTDEILCPQVLRDRGIAIVEDTDKNCDKVEETVDDTEDAVIELGWLSPAGEFVACGWGNHEEAAYDIVTRYKLDNEYQQFRTELPTEVLALYRDFLVSKKNWVLLDNPEGFGRISSVGNMHRLTKRQKEFLYDYYIKAGDPIKANICFKED